MSAACEIQTCLPTDAKVVCQCLHVTDRELVEAIDQFELQTLCEVREQTCAGTGCNSCHAAIRRILDERG